MTIEIFVNLTPLSPSPLLKERGRSVERGCASLKLSLSHQNTKEA